MAAEMKWLFQPEFHDDGTITFKKWKYVNVKDTYIIGYMSIQELREFYGC